MIPREIYTLGAVGFDTSRLANLEGQLLAKREAKQKAEDDAINKYITDLGSKITPAGVRTNDLAEFENKRRKWQAYAIQNKGKISKDPLVRMQSDALYNDVLAFAQQSKKAEEDKKPALDLYRNPTTRGKLNGEKVLESIAFHDLPLTDPRRKEIDYNASWYRDPVYDFAKDFESASKGQQKAFLNRIPGTFDPVSGNWKTEEGYLPQSIKQIANNFATSVASDPEKMDYWERQASKNMPVGEVVRLNKILSNYFPKLQVDADNPLALAMAKAIEQAESIKDQGQQKDVRYQQQLSEKTARAGQKKEINLSDYDLLKDYEPKTQFIDIVKEGPTKEERIAAPTKIIFVKDIGSQDLDLITNKDQVSPITEKGRQPYFKIRDNGDWEGSRGQVIDRANVARANLDRTSLSEEKRGALDLRKQSQQPDIKQLGAKGFKGIPKGGF